MYKVAGTVKYPFVAVSPSDQSKTGLGFWTQEQAQSHADSMNVLRETFDQDQQWNKDFWKTKPEPWIVVTIGS
jgi:hypothetical protein